MKWVRLQSYILSTTTETAGQKRKIRRDAASIVHPFNNNWNVLRCPNLFFAICFNRTSFQQQLKLNHISVKGNALRLQSYILSTTTETTSLWLSCPAVAASIVHPFNNNWNSSAAELVGVQISLQSYILSTTTETLSRWVCKQTLTVLQSYILSTTTETTQGAWNDVDWVASIVHPFNNNWN